MVLQLAGILGLALSFVIATLGVMATISWLRPPRGALGPNPRSGRAADSSLFLRRLALGTGVVAAGVVLGFGSSATGPTLLWTHRAALAGLFVFLLLAQYQQVAAVVCCLREGPIDITARCYLRLWRLTDVAPAPIAMLVLTSGLQLVSRGFSLRVGWLCVIVLGFGFFFFDGILGFTPLTRRLKREALRAMEQGQGDELRDLALSMPVNATLLAHYASFAVLFLFGWLKPLLPNPLAGPIASIERFGGAQLAALLLAALSGLIVVAVRWRVLSMQRGRPQRDSDRTR